MLTKEKIYSNKIVKYSLYFFILLSCLVFISAYNSWIKTFELCFSKQVALNINNKNYYASVACSAKNQNQGFMYRLHIPDNEAMVFAFFFDDSKSFWMKNTPTNITIVYLDKDFNILAKHHMFANSLSKISSPFNTRYAIELGEHINLEKVTNIKIEKITFL